MPKHTFGLLDVSVRKLNARKNAKRLLHDFTGRGDDLLAVFEDYLRNEIGGGKGCSNQRYFSLVDIEIKGRVLWFKVQVGRWGLPGRVVDTTAHSEAYAIRSQDAPVYEVRGALVVPLVGEEGLLLYEVVGGHTFTGALWPDFAEWFHPQYASPEKLSPRATNTAESPAWSKYLDDASLKSVTFTTYERSSNKAKRVLARDWVVRGVRAEVLPKDWVDKLAKRRMPGRSVVSDLPTGFAVEETKLELDGPSGKKTIVLEKDYPRFVYELTREGEPSPTDDEFRERTLSEVSATLEAMGVDVTQALAGAT